MSLSVAIGMHQDAVLCALCAAHRFINDVVGMPTCQGCERVGTERADASLFLPEVPQSTFSLQGLFHLYATTVFTGDFPGRIVGVTVPLYLGVLFVDGRCGGQAEPVLDGFALVVLCRAAAVPVAVSRPSAGALSDPSFAFFRVSPPSPSPQGFEEGRVHMDTGALGYRVTVPVGPSPSGGITCRHQPVCGSLCIILDDFSDVRKERLHVFLRRDHEKFPVVLAGILSEKVTSILAVRSSGLLFREFQSPFMEKIHPQRFALIFQGLFRDPCDNEVSGAGESPPHALAAPYVNVSAHTAPALEPRRTPICPWAHNPGSRRDIRAIQGVALRP
jgi:hypothetical protein